MNPESPTPREQLECRLTALLLGELPADEADALREIIRNDPQLSALHDRLKHTIALVREAAAAPAEIHPAQPAPLRLSDERREKVLASFKTVTPGRFVEKPQRRREPWLFTMELAAVIAVLCMLAGMLLPALSRAKAKSQSPAQRMAVMNNLRQIDGAKQQWALENNKGPDAVPTMQDIAPYMGRGIDAMPKAVAGETYVIGKVGESPAAELDAQKARKIFGAQLIAVSPGTTVRPRIGFSDDGRLALLNGNSTAESETPPPAELKPKLEMRFANGGRDIPAAPASPQGNIILPPTTEPDQMAVEELGPRPVQDNGPPPAVQLAEKEPSTASGDVLSERRNSLTNGPVFQNSANQASPAPATGGGGVVVFQNTLGQQTSENRAGGLGGGFGGSGRSTTPVQGNASGSALFSFGNQVAPDTSGARTSGGFGGGGGAGGSRTDAATAVTDGTMNSLAINSYNGPFGNADSLRDAPASSTVNNNGIISGDGRILNVAPQAARGQLADAGLATRAQTVQQNMLSRGYGGSPRNKGAVTSSTASAASAQSSIFNGGRSIATGGQTIEITASEPPTPMPQGTTLSITGLSAATGPATAGSSGTILGGIPAQGAEPNGGTSLADRLFWPSGLAGSQDVTGQNAQPGTVQSITLANADPNDMLRTLQNIYPAGNNGGASSSQNASQNLNGSAQPGTVTASYDAETHSIIFAAQDGKTAESVSNLVAELDKAGKSGETNEFEVTNKIVARYTFLSQASGTSVNSPAAANEIAKEDIPLAKTATPPSEPQPEILVNQNAFSTFSLNVSDVSFKLAAASLERGVMPDAGSVRTEEFINAFDYRDPDPAPGVAIGFAWERAHYPFAHNRDLLRFSVKTAAAGREPGRPLNIVLLLDNSGSMERADRVAIIKEALKVLAAQLQSQDTISVVTFARTARLWVDGIPGTQAAQVLDTVSSLTPEGGTDLGGALDLAYATAQRHYLMNGVNRVVLLTDGAANLGNVDPASLKNKVEAQRKQGIALDCFGIGWEGYNDDLLEVLTRNGDGRYGFINTPEEAAEGFAGQLAGALHVAASDVKVQVEFNPARVISYRQLGYAKHQLTKEQFRDNTVNAAQIGAAEAGNALYTVEINPSGIGPVCTVHVRYRDPGTEDYHEHAWDIPYTGAAVALDQASPAMKLAATASAFSEWLAASPFAADVTPDALLKCLNSVPQVYGADTRPAQLETMIREAKSLNTAPSRATGF